MLFRSISISGKDLIEAGYKPSKRIAEALDEVLRVKLEIQEITKSEELYIAKKHM